MRRLSEQKGLRCRACGGTRIMTVYTRPKPGGILRRRECRQCGRRFTTLEALL